MKITLADTETYNLYELMGVQSQYCHSVLMQADGANGGNIEFGINGTVCFFIEPGKSSTFPISDLKAVTIQALSAPAVIGIAPERF
jgi:hypothetical protein